MGNQEWIDIRADDGRLFGRLHRVTMDLQIVRGDRELCFDLVATARDGRAVVEQRARAGVGSSNAVTVVVRS